MKQLISVIMCTYNEEQEELIQAIQSILNQTYGCFELLIVLDNPDNQLIRELVFYYAQKDSRIRVIENRQNLGVARSSNRAWRMAKGQYIAKMDADDIASPQRLEKELKTLLERKLDFIAQEMNREANTILSKANDLEISNRGIELKTEIEKVREQIQNIE